MENGPAMAAVLVTGLKSTNQSRIIYVNVNDPILGDIKIQLFVSKGTPPKTISGLDVSIGVDEMQTKLIYHEGLNLIDKNINKQNPIIPTHFDDGYGGQVGAQSIAVYESEIIGTKGLNYENSEINVRNPFTIRVDTNSPYGIIDKPPSEEMLSEGYKLRNPLKEYMDEDVESNDLNKSNEADSVILSPYYLSPDYVSPSYSNLD